MKVYIKGIPFEVVKATKRELGKNTLGDTDTSFQKIRILKSLPKDGMQNVLGHEIAHVYLEHSGAGLSLSHDQIEALCDLMGVAIMDYFTKNSVEELKAFVGKK